MGFWVTELVREFALLLLVVLLAGCFVPAKYSGFRPSGPGTLAGGYCVTGVKDKLRITAPHGVDIFARASNDDPDFPISLTVYLIIPAAVSVQVLSPEVRIRSSEWVKTLSLAIEEVTAAGPRHYQPSDVLPGSSKESMGMFSLWFRPAGFPAAHRFTVDLPAINIDGEQFLAGPVTFEAYSEWGMYTCAQ